MKMPTMVTCKNCSTPLISYEYGDVIWMWVHVLGWKARGKCENAEPISEYKCCNHCTGACRDEV